MRINKMKNNILLLVCFFTALCIFSQENISHYSAEIILSGENNYKEIVLDKDVITKSSSNFRDIRIVDDSGEHVPYFIYNSLEYEDIDEASFESEYLGSFIKAEEDSLIVYEYFDFKIEKSEHSDVYGNHLEIETLNSGFAETVEILGSHDGINWTPVCEAFIYDVGDYSQKTIPFHQTEKYSYYRMKANEHTLEMRSLKLVHTDVTQTEQSFTKEFHPAFTIEEKDQRSIITIPKSELRFLYIDTIQFETSGIFQRKVNAFYRRHEIYRFPFREELLEKNFITVNRQIRDEDLILTIYNGDDRPLEIESITVSYRLQNLVFDASRGGSFFLEYGDATLTEPDYDIKKYGEYILKEGLDLCTLGTPTETAADAPKTFFGMTLGQLFMNAAIVLAAAVLLIIIIAGFKKHGTS